MQARHTTAFPVYQLIVAALALTIVLSLGIGLTLSGKLDGLPVIGGNDAVERVAPDFYRPADRPSLQVDVETASHTVRVHHPADRGPSRNANTTIETNRPADRP